MTDSLLMWLERDLRYNKFPVVISHDWILGPQGDDEHVIRLEYSNQYFINFPFESEIYKSAWNFFRQCWKSGELNDSGKFVSANSLDRLLLLKEFQNS